MQFCVVGSGFFGATVARLLAEELDADVLVIDEREAVGGNSRSFFNTDTGIECHQYGSHIFHTSNSQVWEFVRRFTTLNDYRHRVFIRRGNAVFPMPINLATVNQFYGKALSPGEAKAFLAAEIARDAVSAPRNLEEKAISLVGRPLYEAFIKGYTQKQWGRPPCELPADIITRLPVRTTYHADYFNALWQGVPAEGYGALFANMLLHPRIEVLLHTRFETMRNSLPSDCYTVYTGMLDRLFDYRYGELGWRSLRFDWQTVPVQDYQGTSVMNYADTEIPFTRIHEFKHYNLERVEAFTSNKTVICREYPQAFSRGGEAYYPVNTAENMALHQKYLVAAAKLPRFFVGGRLGAYRYWDMDMAVAEAMRLFETDICAAVG